MLRQQVEVNPHNLQHEGALEVVRVREGPYMQIYGYCQHCQAAYLPQCD